MIDWNRVNDLRDEIGIDAFTDVVEMFLEEADEVISRMTPAGGSKMLEADLHFLKGAALNLGFAEFAALCQEGERRAALGHTDADLAAVCRSYDLSKSALAGGLAALTAA